MTAGELLDFHGMPALRWRSVDGASAIATLQGAQLVSWIPAGGQECLFLSERSAFHPGKAIRGGIPVCFPQFADRGPLTQHGFARLHPWSLVDTVESGANSRATFALGPSPQTLASWPSSFRLDLEATIGGAQLVVQVRVVNTGKASFDFTAALHTYFRISDASRIALTGLKGVEYLERGSSARHPETREAITAEAPIDRIYFAGPAATKIHDEGRSMRIEQRHFTDTVVWNPGRERSAQMADMAPDGYLRMLCVEAAAVEPAIALAPDEEWTGSQTLTVSGP